MSSVWTTGSKLRDTARVPSPDPQFLPLDLTESERKQLFSIRIYFSKQIEGLTLPLTRQVKGISDILWQGSLDTHAVKWLNIS